MMGSSAGNKSLKLLEFLSDPDRAKETLLRHQAAIDEHRQIKADADAAFTQNSSILAQIKQKGDELSKLDEDLTKREEALELANQKLVADRHDLKAREDKLVDDRNDIIKVRQQAEQMAKYIVDQATAKASQTLKEQRDIVERITKEAIEKDQKALEKMDDWTKRHAELDEREKAIALREEVFSRREQKLREYFEE